jgi:hypothetical protein
MSLFDLFRTPTPSAIITAQVPPQQHEGWHLALNWTGTDKMFFGFYCEKCHVRCNTPLLKDVGLAHKVVVRHCGRAESITIADLVAANLPTIRTEPHHHKDMNTIGDTRVMQVGDWGGENEPEVYNGVNAGPRDTEDPRAQLDGQLF